MWNPIYERYRANYTGAQKYELYFPVLKAIFYDRVERLTYRFLPRESRIHIFKLLCICLIV